MILGCLLIVICCLLYAILRRLAAIQIECERIDAWTRDILLNVDPDNDYVSDGRE